MKICTFIVVLEEPPPNIDFSLKDLPGASKIDVVARNLQAIFQMRNTEILFRYIALFTKIEQLVFVATALQSSEKFLDEIEIASLIQTALKYQKPLFTHESLVDLSGFAFYKISNFDFFLQECLKNGGKLFYLKEDGMPIERINKNLDQISELYFILGGRKDISNEHEKTIKSYAQQIITLGKTSYLASTCILKVMYELTKYEIGK